MTLQEVKDYVIPNNFGMSMRELPDWYWSNGIIYAYENDKELWKPYIERALAKVGTDDYGGFYEAGEIVVEGSEYYLCESPFGNDVDNGIIIHREQGALRMYFQFER